MQQEITEIVADIECGGGSPGLDIRPQIPARSSADGDVSTANASEQIGSEYDHEDSLDIHFPTNQTETKKKKQIQKALSELTS